MLSAEEVRELLSYDPNTGQLTWKQDMNSRVKAGDIAGHKDSQGYVVIGIKRSLYKAHRLAWVIQTGMWPVGQIDHEDHIRCNNKWSNLFDVSQRANTLNRKISVRNTSASTGVYKTPAGNWIARICVNRGIINLGTFPTFDAAVQARQDAERTYGFHPKHGK